MCGRESLLPGVSLKQCFVLLHWALEKNTGLDLIQYAYSVIRIAVQKKVELVTLTELHNNIYCEQKNQVFLMHLMPLNDISSQILVLGWFLGTHTATSCLRLSAEKADVSAGAAAQPGATGPLIPNSSTICFQGIERGTSLTFRVVLPVAVRQSLIPRGPGAELCLQPLTPAPPPAASPKEPFRNFVTRFFWVLKN